MKTLESRHCSDNSLLLFADGELAFWRAWRVRRHIAACAACRERMRSFQALLAGAAQAQLDQSQPVADTRGPRALLKARLAAIAQHPQTNPGANFAYLRLLAYGCILALLASGGVAMYRHHRAHTLVYGRMLPDPVFTPGSTRTVALAEICAANDDEVVRSVPGDMQQKVFQEYGIGNAPAAEFEVDYLITPGLGGSGDLRNLWPEPHSNTVWNSYVKDQLEDHLHRMVCERKISLSAAQRAIASDWIAAYKEYFHTEKPLADAEEPSKNRFARLRKPRIASSSL